MVKRTIGIPLVLILMIMSFFCLVAPGLGAEERVLIKAGNLFPDVPLSASLGEKDRSYLGLSSKEPFFVKDIKAKIVLVEIMNVYCSGCQNQAPIYNQMFALIQANPSLRKDIKIIGVAAGNNDQEIKIYQDHFKVPFPIIPDPNYVVHKAIGGSPTPFSIIVKRVSREKPIVVAYTHLGYDENYRALLKRMQAFIPMDLQSLIKKGEKTKATVLALKPPISEKELESKIQTAFTETSGPLTGFGRVVLSMGREIFTGNFVKDGKEHYLFAEVVSELPTCDVCHDFHFIYTFDSSGKILQFIPIQLSKYGNDPWDEADVEKMRRKIVGRYIFNPFAFDGRVDAVTSATITSAGIFKALNDGQTIYKDLKEKGLIVAP
jgi:hypothetical protein